MHADQPSRLDDQDSGELWLDREDLVADPIELFSAWFARAAEVNSMPEAMTLATVDEDGRPDARMVLLKGADQKGFRFFTHYVGTKASQLERNSSATLVFHWPELHRQVRIRGTVEKLDPGESDAYFATRDRTSQIGAWASPQSRVLEEGRAELERYTARTEENFAADDPIPRPEHWGGYIVRPETIEFWQGRRGRLHDRFLYRQERRRWRIDRLAP